MGNGPLDLKDSAGRDRSRKSSPEFVSNALKKVCLRTKLAHDRPEC